MPKKVFAVATVLLAGFWWLRAAPPDYLRIGDAVVFDGITSKAIAAVDHSAEFAASLEHFPSALPGHDDIVFLGDGVSALVSAMDAHRARRAGGLRR